ncbi:MAG: quinone-dependent dihydroorotate dehydrogenase [Acidobacteria bacterium]|nr:quinone-dependent dihydroorotate dehydrogenase [Acidobacteriota bacterium]
MNAVLYSRIIRPLLFALDPEFVHRQTIRAGSQLSKSAVACRWLHKAFSVQYEELRVEAFGLRFQNPVGLAAGFDKHGYVYPIMAGLGFGHMEIGSVSYQPWLGNPSPTLLRLPLDGGLINRLGLNSEGSEVVYGRLCNVRFEIPTGINLVKTADPTISGEHAIEDYLQGFSKFYPLADFITLNLSCPNTIEGRTFEDPELLAPLLERMGKRTAELLADGSRRKPVLIKLSPDLEDHVLDRIVALAAQHNIDGFVIANTTVRRENLKTPKYVLERFGFGGLSGRPLKTYVEEMVEKVSARTARRIPIIACGGIGCTPGKDPAEEVWEYLNLGATLVQLHTGLIYRGPSIVRRINQGLVRILRKNKLSSLAEFFQGRAGFGNDRSSPPVEISHCDSSPPSFTASI